jgi:hypothetical protein
MKLPLNVCFDFHEGLKMPIAHLEDFSLSNCIHKCISVINKP